LSLFLASIATCTGIYVLGFCKQRNLATDAVTLVQRVGVDPRTGTVGQIGIDIQVPHDFPEKYHEALIRAASQCAVRKHLEHPPAFEVKTVVVA
jgi:ribosomal protein S12 methylthiotransferase accessory factor